MPDEEQVDEGTVAAPEEDADHNENSTGSTPGETFQRKIEGLEAEAPPPAQAPDTGEQTPAAPADETAEGEGEDEEPPEITDEQLASAPKGLRDAYKGLKQSNKDLQERFETLEKKVGSDGQLLPQIVIDPNDPTGFTTINQPPAPAPVQAGPPAPGHNVDPNLAAHISPVLPSPEFAIQQLVKVKKDMGTESEMQAALQAVSHYTPDQLMSVIDSAKAGRYGEDSTEMHSVAAQHLVEANARSEINRTAHAAQQEVLRARQESFKNVMKVEGMDDESSAVRKAYNQVVNALVERLPGFMHVATAPEFALEYLELDAKAKSYDSLAEKLGKVETELAEYQKRYHSVSNGQSGGKTAPPGQVTADLTPAEKLVRNVDAMTNN